MKKIGVIYFSGTGNTEFIAKKINDELENNNIEVDMINIEKVKLKTEDYRKYDSLIIGSPVYVERYPEILLKYIKNIPKDYENKCMLFTTQGLDRPTTSFQYFINRFPYLNVTYCESIPMPNNFFNFMFERLPEEEEKKIVAGSMELCKTAVNNFLQGKTNFYPVKRIKVIGINIIYKMFYPFIAKIMTKKIKIDTTKCVKCRLCEKRCPVNAIKIVDKVTINKNCLMCQRCMSNCPKDAFYYKKKKYIQYKFNYK